MQVNRHLKHNYLLIASSDSEPDDSNAGDEEMNNLETNLYASLVNNADIDTAVDTADDKVHCYVKRIMLMF
jgi:hypothetical protein